MEIEDFKVNEAWIIFKVNKDPLSTQEGNANIYPIIDAASTFIMGNIFSLENDIEISEVRILDELNKCWSSKNEWPGTIYIEEPDRVLKRIIEVIGIKGIEFQVVGRTEIEPIIAELCEAFMENFSDSN